MIEEKIIVGENSDFPLNGCLTLPKNRNGKVPAVVFVHGSGASNMDEKVMKLTPFKDMAQGLAKKGIASLRYDKRTYAHPLKLIKKVKHVTVFEETIEDAILASELLRKDERIDSDKIYIVGHSMGAMLAPRIDAEGGNFAGLILLAGSPRTLEEIMIDQFEQISASQKGLASWIIDKQCKKYRKQFENLYTMSDEEAKQTKLSGNSATLYYFKEMGEHPAYMYLKECVKPILIAQGTMDFQATVEKDFNAYKEMLAGKDNVTFKLYDGLNHAFTKGIYTDLNKVKKEYSVRRNVDQSVMDDIAQFIKG